MIVFLQCSTDNTAPTVLKLFEDAICQYGLPEKVRHDMDNMLQAMTCHISHDDMLYQALISLPGKVH